MATTTRLRRSRVPVLVLTVALLLTPLLNDTAAEGVSPGVDVVYIADGRSFADALVGGVLAAMNNTAVLTVEGARSGDLIPDATKTELNRLKPKSIVILGGPVAISDKVRGELGDYTSGKVTRLEGNDRYDTAAKISQAIPDAIKHALYADEAGDADTLDGNDSTDFLAANGKAVDAERLGGLEPTAFGSIFAVRDGDTTTRTTLTPDSDGLDEVQSVSFTAPADGFLQVTASVFLANVHSSNSDTVALVTTLDWDGSTSTFLESRVGVGQIDLDSPSGSNPSSGELSFTASVPVTAGAHTIQTIAAMGSSSQVESNAEALSILFVPSGSATTT